MDLSRESQTWTNTSELEESRDKWREVWIIAESSLGMNLSLGRENSIFQIYLTMTCSPMFLIYLISLVILVNAGDLFPPN